MITKKLLDEAEPHSIIMKGEIYLEDLHYLPVKYTAVRGSINDWALYVGPIEWTWSNIADMGNKIHTRSVIKEITNCDEAALNLYRD